LPSSVQSAFGDFYRAVLDDTIGKSAPGATFVEYAGDAASCAPCVVEPLAVNELRELGASWLTGESGPKNVFVTRLEFPLDRDLGLGLAGPSMELRETTDRRALQVRYVIRKPYPGPMRCPEAAHYREQLVERERSSAGEMARLTGGRAAAPSER
jgi:hypothetical protein